MYSIKQITSRETFPVRHPVLRPGKPIASCIFQGDDDEATVHLGVFNDDRVVGVLSIFEARGPLFDGERQFQLRGMAVLPEYQKKGLGELLMQAAEDNIAAKGGQVIWFNAREVAVGFYQRTGYAITGEPFDIGDIGTHYVMYKRLEN